MTKPNFDLTHPSVSAVIKLYEERAKLAYRLAAAKDDAVRPLYALNQRKQSIQHVGSCVLLKVNNEYLVLSASHVFDSVGGYQLLFGFGDRLHSFAGDRFSSARGLSGSHQDDPIDASVFHISSDVTKETASSFLTLRDLDLEAAEQNPEFYVAAGYRNSQSRSTSKAHYAKLDRYPSMELDRDHYKHLKLSREMHLLLAFEDQVLVDGRWQMSPSIRGLSGGAMFRISNLSPLTSTKAGFHEVKLAAILIGWRKGQRNRFHSAAIGTRLGVHFALIHKYLPELQIDKLVAAESERRTDATS